MKETTGNELKETPEEKATIKGFTLGIIISYLAFVIGLFAEDEMSEKHELKKIVNDSEFASIEEDNNTYELKRTFEPGKHKIAYSYLRTLDSFGISDIEVPEGYEMVLNEIKKIKVSGKKYYQIIVVYKNTTTVVANGIYDPVHNEINYLEAGTPVDTLKLSLK